MIRNLQKEKAKPPSPREALLQELLGCRHGRQKGISLCAQSGFELFGDTFFTKKHQSASHELASECQILVFNGLCNAYSLDFA